MTRTSRTYGSLMILGMFAWPLLTGPALAKGGEGRGPGVGHRPDVTDKSQARPGTARSGPMLGLNLKFKAERDTLRKEFQSDRRALLDLMKAGTITKADYVARKKTLIDQFKKDREALRHKYQLDKKALQAALKKEAEEDQADAKDDEKESTPPPVKPGSPTDDLTEPKEKSTE